ncbi:MAG: hypothetical protein K1X89_20890 [Myxococcaceae bacterium]|nr:hypothetical protein [Myxococcaceae bacterium]
MKRCLSLAAVLAAATASAAYCPCYTLSSTNNTHSCGVEAAGGINPTPAQWQAIFDLVAQGPAVWGSAGPAVANIGQGCGKPMPNIQVPARFPCELLKAIAMQESSWQQFCVPTTPSDQVGGASRTIISFDCGYGIGQVTSGMHKGEAPAFDRARVASDPTYNLATGTQILAGKWKATACVGDNQPSIVEDWYTATWAYNGLAYSNNPSNPAYSSTRGVYNPSVGGSRPYQERVFGWMEHPPAASYWSVLAAAYPDPTTVGGGGSPPSLAEPSCAAPTDCVGTRPVHVSACFGKDAGMDAGPPDAGPPDAGVPDAGPRDAGRADAGPADAGRLDAGPGVIPALHAELGSAPPHGCGCGAAGGAVAWLALLALAARRTQRAVLHR